MNVHLASTEKYASNVKQCQMKLGEKSQGKSCNLDTFNIYSLHSPQHSLFQPRHN